MIINVSELVKSLLFRLQFRHMSARYLRMESYRRALVYQKQYLLLLLGDFQHSVQRVTTSLGQGLLMGTSSRQDMEGNPLPSQHWPLDSPPALVRFRAAARCLMIIHRSANYAFGQAQLTLRFASSNSTVKRA